MDPGFPEAHILSLAFVAVHSGVPDDQAPVLVRDALTQILRSGQDRFVVMSPDEAATRALAKGEGELLRKVRDTWKSHHKVDPQQARKLCEVLGVDGLLLASVQNWEQEKVDWTAQGRSYTKVGLALRIVDAGSGRMIWEARHSLLKESEEYEFSPTQAGVYTEAVGDASTVSRTERASRLGPEPPSYDEVLRSVGTTLVNSLGALPK
jgi:hypothetical protein